MPAAETDLGRTLARHGQAHLLEGVDRLPEPARARFLARLADVDWGELAHVAEPPPAGQVEPADVLTLADRAAVEPELRAAGEEAYRAGRVGVLMVAGGQGTRLGFPGPKGALALAPHSGKSIYALQAEKVVALSRRVGRAVPFLVMTSLATDAATRGFFAEHGSFGLEPEQLAFFVQGTVPSVDRESRGLLARPGELLESPDGHGGTFTALARSGELGRLRAAGVEQLVYVQVDNVLAPVDDPVLVGLAVRERADVVTKVVAKRDPDERVGHLVRVGDRDHVVEYTELTPEDTRARTADGRLIYRWGSPAMHCWSVAFFARLVDRGYRLPLHRSAKPLDAWVDGAVRRVEGYKHERFVFDLIPQAERSVGIEIDREAEFAPVKNAEGPDSPATAVAALHRQYAAWLADAGVEVGEGALVEVSPLYAATRETFLERWDRRVERVDGALYVE